MAIFTDSFSKELKNFSIMDRGNILKNESVKTVIAFAE